MRTLRFHCEVHGDYEIDLKDGQEPPKWCVIREGASEPCGIKLTRKYFIPNIRFTGSGFYSTDNKEK